MHLLFFKLKVLFWYLKKQFIAIKTDVKVNFPTQEYSNFDNFNFFLCEDSRELSDLAKLLTLIQIEFLQFLPTCPFVFF